MKSIFGLRGANLIQRIVFPQLSPDDVANDILLAMETSSPWIVIPGIMKPVIFIVKGLLPTYINDFLTALLGGETGMNDFKGRGGI